MPRLRLPHSVIKPLLLASLTLVVAGGFALAALPQSHPIARTVHPQTPSPTSTPTPATPTPETAQDGSVPAVAGSATVAPQATRPAPTPRPATPAPTSVPTVALSVVQNGTTSNFSVIAAPETNACDLLRRAQAAGFINSLDIRHYDQLQSDYVFALNGLRENWVYKVNGVTATVGCTYPTNPKLHIKAGESVTWIFG